ncbi:MAG TPA: hypothetical protein VMH90_03620 [Thermoplasmata archaeon]|nr:hypothetical protein [Thermoplasmata archaeon]
MRVDLVDRGPAGTARDPIRPLALALAGAGHSVRLFSTEGLDAKAFPGVETIPLKAKVRPGPRGRAALAKTLGTLLDPGAGATVLPFELAGTTQVPRPIAVLPPIDAAPEEGSGSGWLDRFFARRAARREEATARTRARWILAPGEEERGRFLAGAPDAAARTAVVPAAVPDPPMSPDRSAARRLLHLPDDVPVAAWAGAPGPTGGSEIARAAFQRSRVFFPGARLLLAGVAAPTEPGVHSLPGADAATRAAVRRAADVVLAPSPPDVLDLLATMRCGAAALVGRSVRFPRDPPAAALRRPEADDAGALASGLAELFADPALRRRTAEAGTAYADGYAPNRIAALFAPLAGASAP